MKKKKTTIDSGSNVVPITDAAWARGYEAGIEFADLDLQDRVKVLKSTLHMVLQMWEESVLSSSMAQDTVEDYVSRINGIRKIVNDDAD